MYTPILVPCHSPKQIAGQKGVLEARTLSDTGSDYGQNGIDEALEVRRNHVYRARVKS